MYKIFHGFHLVEAYQDLKKARRLAKIWRREFKLANRIPMIPVLTALTCLFLAAFVLSLIHIFYARNPPLLPPKSFSENPLSELLSDVRRAERGNAISLSLIHISGSNLRTGKEWKIYFEPEWRGSRYRSLDVYKRQVQSHQTLFQLFIVTLC